MVHNWQGMAVRMAWLLMGLLLLLQGAQARAWAQAPGLSLQRPPPPPPSVVVLPQGVTGPYGPVSGLPAQYEFGYQVADPEYGTNFGHAETRTGDSTSGQYSVLLPDGRTQVVSYTVNGDSGYVAEVSYQ